ncbi:MAG: TonB-dependent receptor [Bacteroidota bacterium]|nr:TonB-dependent receptor [Bacteroidota bacterium]
MTMIKRIQVVCPVLLVLFAVQNCFAGIENGIGGTVIGNVLTADNKPAEGVTVQLIHTTRTRFFNTNENGFFEFTNVTGGSYEIEISFVGYETIHEKIAVENGKKMQLSYRLTISSKQLQEIVVEAALKRLNAGKLNVPDKDMPLATGMVSNKVISDQQAIRLGDVIKNVPGVSLVQTRFGVNETYGARGYTIGVTGGAGGGSIFKNGLPYNIAGMPEAATLESVEVIKGSSAFLYGSSSGGLIINMISKKPKFNFGGDVSLLMGSNQQYKPVVDVYGPLSKHLAFRMVGTYENDNSYRDMVKTIRTYVNPSLLYRFGKKSSLLLQADYMNAQITPDPGVGLLDSGRVLTKDIPRSRFQNVAWAYNNVLQGGASAIYKQTLNDKLSLNASASFQNTDVDSYGCGNLNTASKTGVVARPLARAHSIEKDYAAQVNVEGKFATKNIEHHFLAGVDYTSITTYTDAFTIYNANGSLLKSYDTINLLNPAQYIQRTDIPTAIKTLTTIAPSNRAGLYVQDLITINKQVKLFAGLRYSYQATVQTTIDSMATATRPASSTKGSMPTIEYNVVSPKLGLVYQPTANTSFYLSYANNFTANTGIDIYGNALPASIINQYEAGLKNTFCDGMLNGTVSIYRIVNSNLAQQAQYLADGVTPNTNSNVKTLSGETTSDGIEVGVNGNISKHFYFITGYAYNYIRFTHTTGSKGSNIEGEQLVNAPSQTANASVFYTFTKGVKGLKLGATGFYTGTRYGGYNNTIGQSITGSRLVALSDFTTVDLSVGYELKKVSLLCKLSNVFNALNYLVHDNYSITPIAPRQLYITLRYQF